jgi:NADH-quinone oxidoreductase subunit J
MEELLFYIFSGGMLFFGLMTITNRNPVNSAIFLVLVFFFMAGLFVLLNAFFLAAVQILVYAGAIMVLFLFVIMLLNITEEEKRKIHWFGAIGSLLILIFLTIEFVILFRKMEPLQNSSNLIGSTEAMGRLLFSKYMLPFEVASVLLLVAMIGVILLSKKETNS